MLAYNPSTNCTLGHAHNEVLRPSFIPYRVFRTIQTKETIKGPFHSIFKAQRLKAYSSVVASYFSSCFFNDWLKLTFWNISRMMSQPPISSPSTLSCGNVVLCVSWKLCTNVGVFMGYLRKQIFATRH